MERQLLEEIRNEARIGNICELISNGVDVNFEFNGETVLHWATKLENEDVVNLLLLAGANVNKLTKENETSALEIAFEKNINIAKILLNHGAVVNSTKESGSTSLHVASSNNDIELTKLLLAYGADVDAEDDNDNTPLHTTVSKNQGNSHFAVFETLLSYNADPNAQNSEGMTPIGLLASTDCSTEIIDLFHKYKADFNLPNYLGATPLHMAILYQQFETIRNMSLSGNLGASEKKNIPSDSVQRFKQHVQIIKCLVKNGANLNTNLCGESPLKLALNMIHEFHKPEHQEDEVELLNFILSQADFKSFDHDVSSIFFDSSIKILSHAWKTILKHVAVLKLQNLSISKSLFANISSRQSYETFFKKCTHELLSAKSTKFKNYGITCLELVTGETGNLTQIAKSKDVSEDLKETDFVDLFPIYGDLMKRRVLELIN